MVDFSHCTRAGISILTSAVDSSHHCVFHFFTSLTLYPFTDTFVDLMPQTLAAAVQMSTTEAEPAGMTRVTATVTMSAATMASPARQCPPAPGETWKTVAETRDGVTGMTTAQDQLSVTPLIVQLIYLNAAGKLLLKPHEVSNYAFLENWPENNSCRITLDLTALGSKYP